MLHKNVPFDQIRILILGQTLFAAFVSLGDAAKHKKGRWGLKSQTERRGRSVTHPVPRSHHGLLFAAQFVEDVVGQLDAARPQLPCREQDRGGEEVRREERR